MNPEIAKNRKALRDYEILEKFEAGIALRGSEVKSIRAGNVNIADAFARVENDEVVLHGCSIQTYAPASLVQHEEKRPRKLLLNRKEINKLVIWTAEKGLALVALRLYWKGQRVKVEIGVGKGKAARDKREDLKKRASDREADREVARFNRGR
jgi:SsrA-binding protein